MRITASVVLYNTKEEQVKTLLECVKESNCISKFYVIDNSPKKLSYIASLWDKIEFIEHENTGYGSSHNIAIRKSIELNSDYHVVLNPDIEFTSEVLQSLASYMDHNKDTVYILPKVIYPDGRLQYLCKLLPTPNDLIFRRFFPQVKWLERQNNKYSLKHSGYDRIMNPPCLSGCFMFLRVKTLEENDLFFDERYFMYLEDFDLMRRLHKVGKTLYYPYVTIIHNHAKESYKNKRMLKIHIQSARKYFNKFGWFFDKERRQMNKVILKEIDDMMIKEE